MGLLFIVICIENFIVGLLVNIVNQRWGTIGLPDVVRYQLPSAPANRAKDDGSCRSAAPEGLQFPHICGKNL